MPYLLSLHLSFPYQKVRTKTTITNRGLRLNQLLAT